MDGDNIMIYAWVDPMPRVEPATVRVGGRVRSVSLRGPERSNWTQLSGVGLHYGGTFRARGCREPSEYKGVALCPSGTLSKLKGCSIWTQPHAYPIAGGRGVADCVLPVAPERSSVHSIWTQPHAYPIAGGANYHSGSGAVSDSGTLSKLKNAPSSFDL